MPIMDEIKKGFWAWWELVGEGEVCGCLPPCKGGLGFPAHWRKMMADVEMVMIARTTTTRMNSENE